MLIVIVLCVLFGLNTLILGPTTVQQGNNNDELLPRNVLEHKFSHGSETYKVKSKLTPQDKQYMNIWFECLLI